MKKKRLSNSHICQELNQNAMEYIAKFDMILAQFY